MRTARLASHRQNSPRRIERLENREMLAGTDLIVTSLESTFGNTVFRYGANTYVPAPGAVATGDHSLTKAQGLVVASDGSYFVSNQTTSSVLHFSNSGEYLGQIGSGTLMAPGALAIHPTTGNLFVGDLGAATIYEFNPAAPVIPASTFSPGYTPGGISFTIEATPRLLVGAIDHQAVYRYAFPLNPMTPQVIVNPGSGIFAASILPDASGNMFIADFNYDFIPDAHHRVWKYTASSGLTTEFINLAEAPSLPAGPPLQPTALLYDQDGNLLVGSSPDHTGNGVVQLYNSTTGALIKTVASGIGTPTGLAYISAVPTDLLASTLEDSGGLSVLRYNDPLQAPVNGGVPTFDHLLAGARGVAVAQDGSFYVSNYFGANVLHYSNTGVFIESVGDGVFTTVGTVAINPADGHLYVGDLGAAKIFIFDTDVPANPPDEFDPGYTPGAIAFAMDYTHAMIVGAIDHQAVYSYDYPLNPMDLDVIVNPGSGIFAASILPDVDGNMYIADFNFDFIPDAHHKIWRYDAVSTNTTVFIDLGPSPTAPEGVPLQATSLLFDHDGNLLVGSSPDHAGNGVIQLYNIDTAALIATLHSGIGSPTGLAYTPSFESVVGKRQIFYNNSKFDGNGNNGGGISASDDLAIATDKSAYLPGTGASTFNNITSFNKGINGVMIDLSGKHAGTLTADDFIFRVSGNGVTANNAPDSWSPAPAPISISLRAGAGIMGTDRVEIVWADGVIKKQWLQVIVKSGEETGLPDLHGYPPGQGDIFFFGNAVGDTPVSDNANFAVVGAFDELDARNHQGPLAVVSNIYDFNRDKIVNSTDELIARNNQGSLRFINVPGPMMMMLATPAATTSGDSAAPAARSSAPDVDLGVASGLASRASGPSVPTAQSSAVVSEAKASEVRAPQAVQAIVKYLAATRSAAQARQVDLIDLEGLLSDASLDEMGL